MTTVTDIALNPQIIGQAENAHLAVLTRALQGTGIGREQWVALNLAHSSDSGPNLVGRVAAALKIDQADAQAVVSSLAAAGLVATDPENGNAQFTASESGKALVGRVRAAVGPIVARVYADLPAEDLQAAARVLTTITARIDHELAAA